MIQPERVYRDCCNLFDAIQEAQGKASAEYLAHKRDLLLNREFALYNFSPNWYRKFQEYKYNKR